MFKLHGFYADLFQISASRARSAAIAASNEADPAAVHSAQTHLERIDRTVPELADRMEESEQLVDDIEALVRRLAATRFPTPHRTLALRHLEDAASRLRRELGDKP